MARIGSFNIPGFVVLIVWILVVILLIILVAWIIHKVGGGALDLRLGHFNFHIGVT